MDYIIFAISVAYLLLLAWSYYVAKQSQHKKQRLFHWAVTWGVVLTLFGIFSGIFVLIAIFSIITNEWEASFLPTKAPVFIATVVSYYIFRYFKGRFKEGD
jgi:heme A synthase